MDSKTVILFWAVECFGRKVQEMWKEKVAAESPSVQTLKGLSHGTCESNLVSSCRDGWMGSSKEAAEGCSQNDCEESRDRFRGSLPTLIFLKRRRWIFKDVPESGISRALKIWEGKKNPISSHMLISINKYNPFIKRKKSNFKLQPGNVIQYKGCLIDVHRPVSLCLLVKEALKAEGWR